jgi:alkylmercury lyase
MTQPTNMGDSSLDEVADAVLGAFPKLSDDEQTVSLALYRLLAQGRPVPTLKLANETGFPLEKVQDMIERWHGVYSDPDGAVVGYWGLALPPMKHRFRVNGNELYTWCAWDALFIPPILGHDAEIESECPVSKRAISLRVTPEGVTSVRPDSVVMSFLTPERTRIEENVVAHFCHYVHFFASTADGEIWTVRHPGAFLMSLDDAWQLGQRKNAAQYQEFAAAG